MAIDSRLKRASVQAYTLGLVRPAPDGTVSAADRAVAGWHYAGLTYSAFVFTPTTRSGWYSFHNAFHEVEFIALMRGESEDAGSWAFWAAGVDLPSNPVPKGTANLELNFDYFIGEANTAAVWCRWALGTQPGNRGNAEINLQIGEEINFA